MERTKKLIGERISLSPILIDDIPKMVEWANDFSTSDGPGVSDFVSSYSSFRENIEGDLKRERPTFAIIKNDTNEFIGYCRIFNAEYLHKIASVSIILDNKFQKNGYGVEALDLLLEYAFNYLNFYNMMLTVYSFNAPAIKCYEKVGFVEFGRRSKSRYLNNKWYDTIYMEIVKDNFNKDTIKNKINY